jgi:SAM-dependent methyltransferase
MTFDVAADTYDRYMGAWSRSLAPQMADLAGVRKGQRVVDVGCGPGSLTSELVSRVGPEAVSAVDPSPPFVAAARLRHPGVDVREAPAEALPFADGAFDAALAQLVVHFMTDPVAGIREMARVTRPGGVVAACVWDFAGGRGPLGPFWEVARGIQADVADESERAGTRQGHLAELFTDAGLRDVGERALGVSRAFGSFDEWWDPFTRGVGPAGGFAASLGPVQREDMRERCRTMLPDGPFELTAHAWAARGVT